MIMSHILNPSRIRTPNQIIIFLIIECKNQGQHIADDASWAWKMFWVHQNRRKNMGYKNTTSGQVHP